MDSAIFQEEERKHVRIMDFNNTNRYGFVWCDMGGSYGSNKKSLGLEELYCLMCFYSTRKD